MLSPPKRIAPDFGSYSRVSSLNSVDLPAPLPPMMAVALPG